MTEIKSPLSPPVDVKWRQPRGFPCRRRRAKGPVRQPRRRTSPAKRCEHVTPIATTAHVDMLGRDIFISKCEVSKSLYFISQFPVKRCSQKIMIINMMLTDTAVIVRGSITVMVDGAQLHLVTLGMVQVAQQSKRPAANTLRILSVKRRDTYGIAHNYISVYKPNNPIYTRTHRHIL